MKTGYTVKEILDTDIADLKKLSGKELKNVVSTLRDASMKRYKRAIKKDELDPAITAFRDKYHGRISVKGKTDKELRRELEKGYYFMQAKSSASEGRQQILEAVRADTGEEKLTRTQIERMWKIIDRMDKMYKMGDLPAFGAEGSPKIRNIVAKQVAKRHTVDYVIKRAEKILNAAYEEDQEE